MDCINIINLPKRHLRKEAVIKQMESENCLYVFWNGVEGKDTKANIHKAFKNVVQHYKNMNMGRCIIGEDDLVWCGKGAWQYYLDSIPDQYDIFVSSYYSGSHDENNVVKGFRGNTLITVHSRFFDQFLWLPETLHLDAALSISGAKIVTAYPFAAVQSPGFSDQRKREANDSLRLKGKLLYGQ